MGSARVCAKVPKRHKKHPKTQKTALHRILLEISDFNGKYAEFVEICDFGDLDPSQNVDIPWSLLMFPLLGHHNAANSWKYMGLCIFTKLC